MNVKKTHETFGENVRMYMSVKDWTTVTLAKASKLPQKTVWTMSRGTSAPTLNKAFELSAALGVSLPALCKEVINIRQLDNSQRCDELYNVALSLTDEQFNAVLTFAKSL